MRNTFSKYLLQKAELDPKILLITGDLGYGVLQEFQRKLPRQFINSGVAEQSMVGLAAGLASQGRKVFVYSIANFPTFRALEQIRNDVSNRENPVTIVSVGAGLGYGSLGYTHHAVEDISAIRCLPNINIYSPCDNFEVMASIDQILRDQRPSYLRLGKGGERELNSFQPENINLPNIIKSGQGGVIVFTGGIGSRAMKVAEKLSEHNHFPYLVSIPFLSKDAITKFLIKFSNLPILCIEEHYLAGGFGSMILEVASDLKEEIRLSRIGVDPAFRNLVGSQDFLLDKSGLGVDNIFDSYLEFLS